MAEKVNFGRSEMSQNASTLKISIFSLTFFTFSPITQLSDVTASQDRLEMKAETKSFPTHLIRARKNV